MGAPTDSPVKSIHRGEFDANWVTDPDGFPVELLVTTFEDGTVRAAVRPTGWTNIRWSPPVELTAEDADGLVRD